MTDEIQSASAPEPESKSPESCTAPNGLPPELIALIDDLPKWLDGVWKFMAITQSAFYEYMPVGNSLMIQQLNQHTRRMRENALALQRRWGTPDRKTAGKNAAPGTDPAPTGNS